MRTRRWIRRAVKWGGAVACVLLLVAWVGSGWWRIGWTFSDGTHVEVSWGEFYITWQGRFGPPGALIFRHHPPIFQEFGYWWPPGYAEQNLVSVKHWVLLAPAALAASLAWRLDGRPRRRERRGRCGSCGYDRTGVPADAVCPECGASAGLQVR